jgi:hypothetical protein
MPQARILLPHIGLHNSQHPRELGKFLSSSISCSSTVTIHMDKATLLQVYFKNGGRVQTVNGGEHLKCILQQLESNLLATVARFMV